MRLFSHITKKVFYITCCTAFACFYSSSNLRADSEATLPESPRYEIEEQTETSGCLDSIRDECGVCNGSGSGPCGCNDQIKDVCGKCGGDGTSCLDCLGVPFGTAEDLGCGCNNPAAEACGCDPQIKDLGCGCGNPAPGKCGCSPSLKDLGCGCGNPAPGKCGCDPSLKNLGCGCGQPAAGPCSCDPEDRSCLPPPAANCSDGEGISVQESDPLVCIEAQQALIEFMCYLANRDTASAYELVSPETISSGDPGGGVVTGFPLDYQTFEKEVANKPPSKFRRPHIRNCVADGNSCKCELQMSYGSSQDNDKARMVKRNGRWYVESVIHIVR